MTHPKRALSLFVVILVVTPALAQPGANTQPPNPRGVTVEAGSGRVLELSGPAANLFVADPKVAEARPASATTVFVFGIAMGHTTIAAMDSAGHPVGVYDVTVLQSSPGAEAWRRNRPDASGEAIATGRPGRCRTQRPCGDPGRSRTCRAMARSFVGETTDINNRLQVGANPGSVACSDRRDVAHPDPRPWAELAEPRRRFRQTLRRSG